MERKRGLVIDDAKHPHQLLACDASHELLLLHDFLLDGLLLAPQLAEQFVYLWSNGADCLRGVQGKLFVLLFPAAQFVELLAQHEYLLFSRALILGHSLLVQEHLVLQRAHFPSKFIDVPVQLIGVGHQRVLP